MILLVVDVQKGISDNRLYKFGQFKENIKLLLETARNNKVEVIYVLHDDGPGTGFSIGDDEYEILKEIAPKENEKRYRKEVNSAFYPETGLLKYILNLDEHQIMIVGLQTDFCIDATIKSGFENGLEMIVPEDTNSSFDNDYMTKEVTYHYYNDYIWPNRYVRCVSMDEALKLLKDTK